MLFAHILTEQTRDRAGAVLIKDHHHGPTRVMLHQLIQVFIQAPGVSGRAAQNKEVVGTQPGVIGLRVLLLVLLVEPGQRSRKFVGIHFHRVFDEEKLAKLPFGHNFLQ